MSTTRSFFLPLVLGQWQFVLIVLVLGVAAHVIRVGLQIVHYRFVFSELSSRWRGARIGTGAAGGRVAASAMAILVADDRGIVQAARLRVGSGTFAKFAPREDFVGLSLADLGARTATDAPAVQDAVGRAIAALEGAR